MPPGPSRPLPHTRGRQVPLRPINLGRLTMSGKSFPFMLGGQLGSSGLDSQPHSDSEALTVGCVSFSPDF